jgi:sRNA-binding protein
VLSHDQRIGLDGSPAEMVDAEAKELATRQMAQLEARKGREESSGGHSRHGGEAEAGPDAADRDAGANSRPSACRSLAPARVGGHVLPVYVRDDDLLRDHAGAGLL